MQVKSSLVKTSVLALIVGALLAVTLYIFFAEIDGQRIEHENETRERAKKLAFDFEKNMQAYIGTLSAVERFVVSSEQFSFDQFELFTRDYYRSFPGIHALSWNKLVNNDQLAEFERSIDTQGFTDFRVKQRFALGKAGLVEARPVYFPVTYITPFDKNKGAHGHDTYAPDPVSGNVRQQILDRARDEGRAITTGRITLVQLESQFGLLVYKPVYDSELTTETTKERRKHLIGYVAAVFVVPQVLKTTAQQAEKHGLAFEIRDISMPDEKQFLYHSRTADNQKPEVSTLPVANSFEYLASLDVAGHHWEMDFTSFRPQTVEYPWQVLLVGLLVISMFTAVAHALLTKKTPSDQADSENLSDYLDMSVVVIWILIVGLVFTVALSFAFREIEKQEIERLKYADARTHFQVLQRHVNTSLDILESIGSFFEASKSVSRDEFKKYVAPFTEKNTGAQGFVWIPRIAGADRVEFESEGLSTDTNAYSIKELGDGVLIKAGEKSEYYPIHYVEPHTINSIVMGFDLASDEVRGFTLRAAGDKGEMLASSLLSLVVDGDSKPGVIVFKPIYEDGAHFVTVSERRQKLSGFVALAFSLNDVFSASLHNRINNAHIRVEDVTDPGSNTLLFNTKAAHVIGEHIVSYTEVLAFAGRQWLVSITPNNSSYGNEYSVLPWVIFASGLLATGLLTFIVLQLTSRGRIVEDLVDERTAQLKEVEAFQKLMISTIPDYVFVMDSDYQLVSANPLFLSLYPDEMRESLIGLDLRNVANPFQIEGFLKNSFAFDDNESYEKFKFRDGKIHTLLSKRVGFQDKNGDSFVLSLSRDVTEREQLVRQLTVSNEELDEFAYIASHDLKEPLRGIHNHASIYLRKSGESIDEDGQRRLNRIMELTKYMELLVSDLLYFSRVGRTDIAMQSVDMHELVCSVVNSMSIDGEPKVEIIVSDELPAAICDMTRIGEVFRNLIVNALKYNESETKIVSVGLVNAEIDGDVRKAFYVKDNGIGIDRDFHLEIFRIFKRLHKKTAYGGGTGSGLTFVKKIIDRHEGQVWLESSLGAGSTFYFTLPNAWSNKDSSQTKGDL